LDDLLVGAPVEEVDDEYAGEDVPERHRVFGTADGIEVFGNRFAEGVDSAEDSAVAADQAEAENGDQEAADQQADAVQRVGDRGGTQSAEERIGRPDPADHPDHHPEQRGVVLDAGEFLQIEHAGHPLGARVEDHRQQDGDVGEEKNQVADHLGAAVETDFQQLGNGGDSAAKEAGEKEERHGDQSDHGDHFPDHNREPVGEGIAVEPDHLLGGEVGQQERPGDDRKSQRTSGEEEAVLAFQVLAAGEEPGDHGHQPGEEQERNHGKNGR